HVAGKWASPGSVVDGVARGDFPRRRPPRTPEDGENVMDIVKAATTRLQDGGGQGMAMGTEGRLTPLQIIWHRRTIVLLTMIACVIGALVLSLLLPRVYTRSTQIVVEPVSLRALGDGMNLESYLNTQVELISKSSAIHA